MNEPAQNEPAEPAAEQVRAEPTGAARWVARVNYFRTRLRELAVVFFGVYAAFLLNRFETDRRDTLRRTQILEALEHETRESVDDLAGAISQNEPLMAEFDRRLAGGEMPGLSISMNNSSYSPTDDATLLQAGGLELLDVQTIELLRAVNAMERAAMAERHNQFELSLVEIANRESDDFYDPETRRLKRRYEWWPYIQHRAIADAKALLEAEKALLEHLKAERAVR